MIGYVVNYKDSTKRTNTPSGLLVTHPMTKQIIALGASSLSKLLQNHFTQGVSLTVVGDFAKTHVESSKPYDLDSFESLAPKWFDKAGLNFKKIAIQTPMSAFVPVAADLSAAYNKEPFEKIQIVAGRLRK